MKVCAHRKKTFIWGPTKYLSHPSVNELSKVFLCFLVAREAQSSLHPMPGNCTTTFFLCAVMLGWSSGGHGWSSESRLSFSYPSPCSLPLLCQVPHSLPGSKQAGCSYMLCLCSPKELLDICFDKCRCKSKLCRNCNLASADVLPITPCPLGMQFKTELMFTTSKCFICLIMYTYKFSMRYNTASSTMSLPFHVIDTNIWAD